MKVADRVHGSENYEFGQERAMPTWVACAARVRVDRRSKGRRRSFI